MCHVPLAANRALHGFCNHAKCMLQHQLTCWASDGCARKRQLRQATPCSWLTATVQSVCSLGSHGRADGRRFENDERYACRIQRPGLGSAPTPAPRTSVKYYPAAESCRNCECICWQPALLSLLLVAQYLSRPGETRPVKDTSTQGEPSPRCAM